MLDDMRVRRTEHDVDRLRMIRENPGERIDDILDALVRREQAEGENQWTPFDAEPVLAACERNVRNPVRDDIDPVLG